MSDLAPRYTASAVFSDQGNGVLTLDALPQKGIAAQLAPFYKGDTGPIGAKGDTGPIGAKGDTGPIGAKGDAGVAGGVVSQVIAATALSGHRAVYLSSTGARYASALDPSTCDILGVTLSATATNEIADVQTAHEITEPSWGWLIGQPVWLGADGFLTQATPVFGAQILIGIAVNTQKILLRISQPINLI
jgi:hypothetical protein